jgi:hypothetical protein
MLVDFCFVVAVRRLFDRLCDQLSWISAVRFSFYITIKECKEDLFITLSTLLKDLNNFVKSTTYIFLISVLFSYSR